MPFKLRYAEFYITNVCNFNCDGCNRFNNLNFSGRQRWKDYQDKYRQWAEVLDLERFSILGGEPMTSPDYLDWLVGISRLWPQAHGDLTTNAHYLKVNNKNLYDVLLQSQQRLVLNVGLHNRYRTQTVLDTVTQWLVGPISIRRTPENLRDLPGFDDNWKKSYQQIKDETWPDCDTVDDWFHLDESIRDECQQLHRFSPDLMAEERKDWHLVDANGVIVNINHENHFTQHNLLFDKTTGGITLPNSDPAKAHAVCEFANSKCYHFIRGKLYKCGPVALFPEMLEKFPLDLSPQDRKLIDSYVPGNIDDLGSLSRFLDDIDMPIPQCKFCPQDKVTQEIFAKHGKKTMLMRRR